MAQKKLGRSVTLSYLKELYISNTDEEVLLNILANVDNLKSFVNDPALTSNSSSLLLHIIARCCSSRTRSDCILKLFCTVVESPLLTVKPLDIFAKRNNAREVGHSYNCLIDDLIVILQEIVQRIPSSTTSPQIIGLVDFISEFVLSCDEIQDKEYISEKLTKLKDDIIGLIKEKSRVKSKPTEEREDKMIPPDDFRRISVFPSHRDIYGKTEFLRRNKVSGKYLELDHYLDVQFRLYREDFISPLRSAVKEYIHIRETNNQDASRIIRLEDGRIYRNVEITGTSMSPECGEVHIVDIDLAYANRIDWASSKRLIYGSLVCLSFDDFQTIIFAVIVDSDRETLSKNGQFKAQLIRSQTNQKVPFGRQGLMIESSSAYFEAYRHVLQALKNIHDEMPFQRYIVDCQKDINPPKYLVTGSSDYNLRPVLHSVSAARPFDIMNIEEWPSMEELHLDEAQWEAFHAALTKEFVVIQGPPGTGKTHIGLQIAKTLLFNRTFDMDRHQVKSCILLVCFTNHALDQFLEGIIKYLGLSDFDSIVRIGSRCKNPLVENFTLSKHRYRYVNDRPRIRRELNETEVSSDTLCLGNRLKCRLREIQSKLYILKTEHIVLRYSILKGVMTTAQRQEFGKQPDDRFYDWLQVSEECWYRKAELHYQGLEDVKTEILYERGNTDYNRRNQSYIDIVSEAEYEFTERHIDDEDDTVYINKHDLGLDIVKQLATNEKNNIEEKCRLILRNEAEKAKQNIHCGETVTKDASEVITNLWELTLEDRWRFYRYWVTKYIEVQKKRLSETEKVLNSLFDAYKEAKLQLEEEIMSKASIIALTTTAAARYYSTLAKLRPTVTIVEEAAEVLEAHIITALSKNCEHVILIGDHRQLEPKPAVYELAIKYNLSVSLFERMINNNLPYYCLQKQHRMRAEFSELVRHIYPKLEDNDNVLFYPDVQGIRHNLYFISHSHNEVYNDNERSYSNEFEAEYAKELCRFLLNQDYKPDQITILAAYSGQMYKIRNKMPKHEFEGVRVCVLDNYQGEENDIIILSLVRSNENGNIGFLNKENRICVALSRAKIGLYILGNMETLTKKSQNWEKIRQKLISTESNSCFIGEGLFLYCQNHPEKEDIHVISPLDFQKVPDGGCGIPCEFRLECGHACSLRCHSFDKDHKDYKCRKACPKKCPEGHKCRRTCHLKDECKCPVQFEKSLPCGHTNSVPCHVKPTEHLCYTEVQRNLKCQHTAVMQCHYDIRNFKCQENITDKRYQCGHVYTRQCYLSKLMFEKKKFCSVLVEKKFKRCRHTIEVPCYQEVEKLECKKEITKNFMCGHSVETLCFREDKIKCQENCDKICENGHPCTSVCHFPDSCQCPEIVERRLSGCNHLQKMKCSMNKHNFECQEIVEKIVPRCGHIYKTECFRNAEKISCMVEMKKQMRGCGHKQRVPCSVDPLLDNVKCETEISLALEDCGHTVTVMCWQSKCETKIRCTQPVPYTYQTCKHSTYIPCWSHTEKLLNSNSDDVERTLDLPPCSQQIKRTLPCGHPAVTECHKSSVERTCTSQCNKTLYCGHVCKSMCKDCQGGDIHVPCSLTCEKYHLCGHMCQGKCLQCKPCGKQCLFSCEHSRCNDLCANPCNPCKKICAWQCPHFKCSKMCNEICDRPKCTHPCKVILRCGHMCSGYCGEPCPEFCCDCKPGLYHFMGNYENCRTVTLKECGHAFPDKHLDEHIRKTKDILVTKCPFCSVFIHKHPRYDRILKCKKRFLEESKMEILLYATNKRIKFPTFKEDIFNPIEIYIQKFFTFIQITKHLNSGSLFRRIIRDSCQIATKVQNALEGLTDVQTTVDVFRQIYKLFVYWILCICTGKPNVMGKNFSISWNPELQSVFDENDEKCNGIEDPKTDKCCKTYSDMESRSKNSGKTKGSLENLPGYEIVDFVRSKVQYNKFEENEVVEKCLSLLLEMIEDDGHLANARSYPLQPDLIGIHEDQWAVCRKGHVHSKISGSDCKVCRTTRVQTSAQMSSIRNANTSSWQATKEENESTRPHSEIPERYERQDKFAEGNKKQNPRGNTDKRTFDAGHTAKKTTIYKRESSPRQTQGYFKGNFRKRANRSHNRQERKIKPVSLGDFIPEKSEKTVEQNFYVDSAIKSDETIVEDELVEKEEFPSLPINDKNSEGDLKYYRRQEGPNIWFKKRENHRRK